MTDTLVLIAVSMLVVLLVQPLMREWRREKKIRKYYKDNCE